MLVLPLWSLVMLSRLESDSRPMTSLRVCSRMKRWVAVPEAKFVPTKGLIV